MEASVDFDDLAGIGIGAERIDDDVIRRQAGGREWRHELREELSERRRARGELEALLRMRNSPEATALLASLLLKEVQLIDRLNQLLEYQDRP
jgi:hypothetical protein